MQSPVWKYLILIGSLTLLLEPSQASAGKPFGTYRQPKCPPYSSPCYGYYPTIWRPWPAECERPPAAVVQTAPAPSAADTQTPQEKPAKDKKETGSPEKIPLPKPDDSQSRRGTTLPRIAGELDSKPNLSASPSPHAWDPLTGRMPEPK
jgi:hypothetical protein